MAYSMNMAHLYNSYYVLLPQHKTRWLPRANKLHQAQPCNRSERNSPPSLVDLIQVFDGASLIRCECITYALTKVVN